MIRIAVQVRELLSSNVTQALEKASDPGKLLNRLKLEIEESIIALQGELTKAERRKDHAEQAHGEQEKRAAEWQSKAAFAMDHSREDLARQALAARNEARDASARQEAAAVAIGEEIAEIETAIGDLGAKRTEVMQQAAAMANAPKAVVAPEGAHAAPERPASKAEKHRDRIARMEQRTAFATEHANDGQGTASGSTAAVEAEIDQMRREAELDRELAEMRGDRKAPAKAKPRRKSAKAANG